MNEMLKNGALKLDISLDECQLDQLVQYSNLLLDWNSKINLTAITDKEGIITKHFLDSLTALKYTKGKVIDVGTGAGFPGLVLKIADPTIELTLLDSLKKRITFLQNVCSECTIKDVEFLHGRAEDYGIDNAYREKFDTVVSRAVANMTTLSEWCLPFLKIGGRFLALKGPLAAKELDDAREMIKILGGEVEDVIKVSVPFTDLSHEIIMIKKVKSTPKKYPRKPGRKK